MIPQWYASPQSKATAEQIAAAAARGAQPMSNASIREWFVGQALAGLSTLREVRMEDCAEAAQRGADAVLIQLQMAPPPAPPAPAPTTPTTTTK